MAGKIFYRERRKVDEGEKQPRFRVVAAAGCDAKFFAEHLRLGELKAIAEVLGADLVPLEGGGGEGEGGGRGRKGGHAQ
jgi:hypothetical protein